MDLLVVELSLVEDAAFLTHFDRLLQLALKRWRDPRLEAIRPGEWQGGGGGKREGERDVSVSGAQRRRLSEGEGSQSREGESAAGGDSISGGGSEGGRGGSAQRIVELVEEGGPLGGPAVVMMSMFAFCRNLTLTQCKEQVSAGAHVEAALPVSSLVNLLPPFPADVVPRIGCRPGA